MRKQTPVVEWYIAEDDTDWTRLCAESLPGSAASAEPAAQGRLGPKQFLWKVATILLLLASAGYWWYSTPSGLHQGKAALRATAERERRTMAPSDNPFAARLTDDQATLYWELHFAQEHDGSHAGIQTSDRAAHLDLPVDTSEVQGDQAVARVVMYTEHGAPAYRQTRFYQRTGPDWRQTAPAAALWGPVRSLEMPSFVFHFRQHDAPAVFAVAPQVEVLYKTLQRNFRLPIPSDAKRLVIEVSVTQPPGQAAPWFDAPARIIVPSPAVYLAPMELTDAELLAQSISLPLLEHMLAQASERHAIGEAWQPMVNGLRLWQVWDLGLPLAAWREEVVQWLYVDLPRASSELQVVLPDRYEGLCAAHTLWLPSPAQLGIPLICAERRWEEINFSSWSSPEALTRLEQLPVPMPSSDPYVESNHLGRTVALATLIEYAVATYGRERLPALVVGLGQYQSWNTLLPAVYGVSPAEFEAGWQAYLAAHYGG